MLLKDRQSLVGFFYKNKFNSKEKALMLSVVHTFTFFFNYAYASLKTVYFLLNFHAKMEPSAFRHKKFGPQPLEGRKPGCAPHNITEGNHVWFELQF